MTNITLTIDDSTNVFRREKFGDETRSCFLNQLDRSNSPIEQANILRIIWTNRCDSMNKIAGNRMIHVLKATTNRNCFRPQMHHWLHARLPYRSHVLSGVYIEMQTRGFEVIRSIVSASQQTNGYWQIIRAIKAPPLFPIGAKYLCIVGAFANETNAFLSIYNRHKRRYVTLIIIE